MELADGQNDDGSFAYKFSVFSAIKGGACSIYQSTGKGFDPSRMEALFTIIAAMPRAAIHPEKILHARYTTPSREAHGSVSRDQKSFNKVNNGWIEELAPGVPLA